MIRSFFILIVMTILMHTGCSAQKDVLLSKINNAANKEPVEDSVLQQLQKQNDIVIAYAVENFAWISSADYRILAQHNGEWQGYFYHKNLMKNNAGSPTSISTIKIIDKDSANALMKYIAEKEAWNIKGDSDTGFCTNGNKNCNINDAPSAVILIATKTAAVASRYYAPEFFQKCCPDEQRAIFLSITKKIEALAGQKNNTE
jgi:hypothetical protein